MATVGSLIVDMGVNVARMKKDLGKVNQEVRRQTTMMKNTFKGAVTVISGFFGAQMLRKIVDVTTTQQNALNQLEAGIRSTAGAAGQSVQDLAAFAASMQKVTTYGDEAVMGMQGVLLTFTKIHGDTFPRATKATLDLAARMGTDLTSAALQVGKALNDPISNMGALSRAGIQFTDDQKKVIKALWESGQQAKAQAVILQELETQFGGSAEAARNTLGGALKSLSNTFWDFFEMTRKGSDPLIRIIELLNTHLHTMLKVILALVAVGFAAKLWAWAKAMYALSAATLRWIKAINIKKLGVWLVIMTATAAAVAIFKDRIDAAFGALKELMGKHFPELFGDMAEGVKSVNRPMIDVTGAVGDLGVSLKEIKKLFEEVSKEGVAFAYKFSQEMEAIADEIEENFSTNFDSIQNDWESMADEMAWTTEGLAENQKSLAQEIADSFGDSNKLVRDGTFDTIQSIQGGFHSLFSKTLKGEIRSFQDAADAGFDVVLEIVTSVSAQIATAFTMKAIGPMIGGIGDWVSSMLQGSQTAGTSFLNIMGPTGWAITGGIAAAGLLTLVWDDFGDKIMDVFEGVGEFVFGIFEQIINGAKSAAEAAGDAFGGLGDIASGIPIVGTVVDAAGDVFDSIGDVLGGLFHQGGLIRHQGGPVVAHSGRYLGRGLASDEVPVIARRGEYVVQESAVDKLGVAAMDAINRGQLPAGQGGNSLNVTYNIDARGAGASQVAQLKRVLYDERMWLKNLVNQTGNPLVTA